MATYRQQTSSPGVLTQCPTCPSPSFSYYKTLSSLNANVPCGITTGPDILYSSSSQIVVGMILYTDSALTSPFIGNNAWIGLTKAPIQGIVSITYQVSNSGEVLGTNQCGPQGQNYTAKVCGQPNLTYVLDGVDGCSGNSSTVLPGWATTLQQGDVVWLRTSCTPSSIVVCAEITGVTSDPATAVIDINCCPSNQPYNNCITCQSP